MSTVDSGNLCVHLVAVAQACSALAQQPLDPQASVTAIRASRARLQLRWGALPRVGVDVTRQPALNCLLDMQLPHCDPLPGATAFGALLDQAQEELTLLALHHRKGAANTRVSALARYRRYAVAVGGCQMCGSSWSMSRALWVGNRVSTSFRYA